MKKMSTSWKAWTDKTLMQGLQIDNSPIKNPIEILVKYEFEYREKLKRKMFSSEILDYQDTDARKKNSDFLVEYSSTSAVFSMEEIELVASHK